jgi:hypothetical protein
MCEVLGSILTLQSEGGRDGGGSERDISKSYCDTLEKN